jgi:uncharacterized protein YcbK (DUF882 family)
MVRPPPRVGHRRGVAVARTLITPSFAVEEFACRDGSPYPKELIGSRLLPLCQVLEVVREAAGGRPLRIISGFRSEAYNRKIGGARASQHVQGRAADIQHPKLTAGELHTLVLDLYRAGKLPHLGGLGAYVSFCHLDVRATDRLVRWSGSRIGS